MSIEYIDEFGTRIPIARGWVILTLAMAAWGVVSLTFLIVWGIFHLA